MVHRRRALAATLATGLLVVACGAAAAEPVEFELSPLSGSGVSGTVTLLAVGANRTEVTISVDPAGHPSMPAHIHPGTCLDLVPQPRYPLTSVDNGRSTTEVPASLAELLAGDVAVNLHASNDEMQIYTACVDLH
jgi:hypothetical protein